MKAKRRFTSIGNGITMVDEDPYIVFNDEMREHASKVFKEAESKGYTSTEDKARYLSGKIYDDVPFGISDGVLDKDAIEHFKDMQSGDEKSRYKACFNRAVVQRALLESQGVRTRNFMFEIPMFNYPMLPVKNEAIKKMNESPIAAVGKFLGDNKFTFAHYSVQMESCKDEKKREGCEWKTLDATFDGTDRMLNARPEPNPTMVYAEDHPESFTAWKEKWYDPYMRYDLLVGLGLNPLAGDIVQRTLVDAWFKPLEKASKKRA